MDEIIQKKNFKQQSESIKNGFHSKCSDAHTQTDFYVNLTVRKNVRISILDFMQYSTIFFCSFAVVWNQIPVDGHV